MQKCKCEQMVYACVAGRHKCSASRVVSCIFLVKITWWWILCGSGRGRVFRLSLTPDSYTSSIPSSHHFKQNTTGICCVEIFPIIFTLICKSAVSITLT